MPDHEYPQECLGAPRDSQRGEHALRPQHVLWWMVGWDPPVPEAASQQQAGADGFSK